MQHDKTGCPLRKGAPRKGSWTRLVPFGEGSQEADCWLVPVFSAAPNGDNVFLALLSDQVGNYKHINALQSNSCQDNRWQIPLSNLDLAVTCSVNQTQDLFSGEKCLLQNTACPSLFAVLIKHIVYAANMDTASSLMWTKVLACYINSLKPSTAST